MDHLSGASDAMDGCSWIVVVIVAVALIAVKLSGISPVF